MISRGSIIWAFLLSIASIFGIFIFKQIVGEVAQRKAGLIIDRMLAKSNSFDEFAENLTKHVHSKFVASNNDHSTPLLFKLRPYLTHRLVPSMLRIRSGAIEMIYLEGLCDNASRSLAFIFREAGNRAQQLNIVTQTSAHSALQVTTKEGRQILVDPFFGTLPFSAGRILSAISAKRIMKTGTDPKQIWKLLNQSSNREFYKDFGFAKFAHQGEELIVEGHIRLRDGKPLQLGTLNGSSEDVSADGSKAKLTPYWHYVGSRYDRSWIRSLIFQQDTRVIFHLTELSDERLITSNHTPEVSGNKLVYELNAGKKLLFHDGRAGYDWLRLRSYQDVDFIRFEPIK